MFQEENTYPTRELNPGTFAFHENVQSITPLIQELGKIKRVN